MKIVGLLMTRNEMESGHAQRYIKYNMPVLDDLVVYDDKSDDGTGEFFLEAGARVIQGEGNFKRTLFHHAELLEKGRELGADWFFWGDTDEILERRLQDRESLERVLRQAESQSLEAVTMLYGNMWEKEGQIRVDGRFSGPKLRFRRLVRNGPSLKPVRVEALHHREMSLRFCHGPVLHLENRYLMHFGFFTREHRHGKRDLYESWGQFNPRQNWYTTEENPTIEQLPGGAWHA